MSRSEFLAHVAQALGIKPTSYQLDRALLIGAVSPPEKYADGWFRFGPEHVDQFAEYLRTRSRKFRRQLATAGK